MSKQTQMKGKDTPEMEFLLSESEVDAPLKVGDVGSISIPVVIVAINDGMVTFRKTDNISIEGGFRKETLDEMRQRIISEQDEKPKEDVKE